MSRFVNVDKKKAARTALKAIGALLVVGLLFATVARVLIERSVHLEQVLQIASDHLGRTVRARSIEISPFFGLILEGVTVNEVTGDTSRLLIEAKTIRVRPSWWRLLTGRFQVARVTLIDGVVHFDRDTEGWNLLRWQTELATRQETGALEPAIRGTQVRLLVNAPGESVDGWNMLFASIAGDPGRRDLEFVVNEFGGEKTRLEARVNAASSTVECEFEDAPVALARVFGSQLTWDAFSGSFTLVATPSAVTSDSRIAGSNALVAAWASVSIEGEAHAKRLDMSLPQEAALRLVDLRARKFAGRYLFADDAWQGELKNVTIHGTGAQSVRMGLRVEGHMASWEKARLEWEGPIERVLALAPPKMVREIMAVRPHGASTGHILLNAAALRGNAYGFDASFLARGVSLTIPAAKVPHPLTSDLALENIRGRIEIDAGRCRIDSVAFQWGGDPFIVSGALRLTPVDSAVYDVTLHSSGFDVARAAVFLPPDIRLQGRVGATIHATPSAVTGSVAFLGTTMRHASLGEHRLLSGRVLLGAGSRLSLEEVEVAAGGGAVVVNGEIGGGSARDATTGGAATGARSLALTATLRDASLASLASLAGDRFSSAGMKILGGDADGTVEVRGTTERTVARGTLALKAAAIETLGLTVDAIEGPVKFDSNSVQTSGITARVGDGLLRVAGNYGEKDARFTIGMTRVNAALFSSMLVDHAPGLEVSGPIDAELAVAMRKTQPYVTGSVTFHGTTVATEEELRIEDLNGTITVAGDRVTARAITGSYLGGVAKVNGTIPLADTASWQLALQFDRARLEHFARFVPEGFTLAGPAEAVAITLSGLRSAPSLQGAIRFAGASIKAPFLAAGISDVRGEAVLGADSFSARGLVFKTGQSMVRVTGGVDGFARPVFRGMAVQTENARFGDLISLIPEADRPLPKGATISGSVSIDSLRIDGPLEAARWNGRVALKDGAAELPGLARGITNLNGELVFVGAKMQSPSLAAHIGSSEVRIEGDWDLAPPYGMNLRLAILAADLSDLLGALPDYAALEKTGIRGRGTVAATLQYAPNRVRLEGSLVDGATEGFGMPFEDVSGAFRYDGTSGALTLSNLKGRWANGQTENGSMRVDLNETPPTFEAAAEIRGSELSEMLRLAGYASAGYGGRVDADFKISGKFGARDSVNGEGWVKIAKARFEKLQPIDALSRTLRMDFFSRSTYESARGTFIIDKGVVRTVEPDHFRFNGTNFTLEARGYTTFGGDCAYNYACGMQAGLVGNVMTNLGLSRLFSVDGQNGIIRTSGSIAGRIDNPVVKTDLGILNVFR